MRIDNDPEDWPPDMLEYFVRGRVDRELDSSLIRAGLEHRERRAKMPASVRQKDDAE